MLVGSIASIVDPDDSSQLTSVAECIGHEVIALLIAVVFSCFSLGFSRAGDEPCRQRRTDRAGRGRRFRVCKRLYVNSQTY
jgi:H+/gluconate symporter-like permease